MAKLTPEEEKRKRAIFDSMSPRSQKRITKIGYDEWDPFEKPKDPLDLRMGKEMVTAAALMKSFLVTKSHDQYSNEYGQGVFDISMGILSKNERYMGMFEFCCWYYEQLKNKDKL